MESMFTSLTEAKAELLRRRQDRALDRKIADYFGGDVPQILRNDPAVVLFRHVANASGEARRLLEFAKAMNLPPAWLEFTQDRFFSFNPDKYAILGPKYFLGMLNGQEHITKVRLAEVPGSEGRPFTNIATKWSEPLVDFQHHVLYARYPEWRDRVEDVSGWLTRHGDRAAKFYERYLALFVRHAVLAEFFEYKNGEEEFMHSVFAPAFERVKLLFGVRPLIVRLDPVDAQTDSWRYADAEAFSLTEAHIKDLQEAAPLPTESVAC